MMRTLLLATALGTAAWAADPPGDDQRLIERAPAPDRPAARPAAVGDVPPVSDDPEERAARADANLAAARLEIVLARKAARSDDPTAAARHAHRAQVLLRQLPPDMDTEELDLQAEGILSRAAKKGVDLQTLARDAAEEAPLAPDDRELDRRVQGAARVARQYEGPPRPDVDPSGNARTLRERTLRRQAPDRYGYHPGREIIDVEVAGAAGEARTAYQGALERAVKEDEVRVLVNADESRLVPDGEVAYPPDWPERTARRQAWAGGMVARTPSWRDKDGREWFVAVYDIHDLIYVPPDFLPGAHFRGIDAFTLQTSRDREALRRRSMIFGGGAIELAEGIPLLRYFGGVDPFVDRGPKYSPEKQAEIVKLIQAFTGTRVEGTELPPAPR